MRDLRGKRALITGAGSGIGRAIAMELARAGARLYLLDLKEQAVQTVANEARSLGVESVARQCDLADQSQIEDAVRHLLKTFGGLDLLVNNAGIVFYGPTHEMTREQWERLLAVNLLAPIRLIHVLLPTLREQGDAHILNVSSITGLVPKRRTAAYQTTKFALVGLSQSLRAEYSAYGVGVTVLCPGFVETNLLDTAQRNGMTRSQPRLKSWMMMSPQRVAQHAVRAIKRNQGIVVVPFLAKVFWWMQRISPSILDWHSHRVHRRAARRQRKRALSQK